MSETMIVSVIAPVVLSIVGGIGWFIKHQLEKVEKKQEAQMQERNKEREQIKTDIKDLQEDVRNIASIVIGCENPNCPSRRKLADYFNNKWKKSNE